MKLLKQEAIFEEVQVGDIVELLDAYLLIRAGSRGKVVSFEGDRIKIEFPVIEIGQVSHFPVDKNDRFIYAKPEELKFIKKGNTND